MKPWERLIALGLELPRASAPVANYIPVQRTGRLVFVAGQVCAFNGEYKYIGEVGRDFTLADGQAAARLCALNILAQLQAAIGSLDRVKSAVKLTVFIRVAPGFTDLPLVANGASDLIAEVFGERGRHVRAAVGVSQLPFGVAVEVDSVFEVDDTPA